MPGALLQAGTPVLRPRDEERLRAHAVEGVRRARRAGRCLVSVTVGLPGRADPTAIVAASRAPGEDWFCYEQPDRDRFALATLGSATAMQERGARRFPQVAAQWRELVADAVRDEGGPHAVGGFGFAPDGGTAPHWAGFAPASLQVPAVALARRGERTTLTLAALAAPDDDPGQLATAMAARAQALHTAPLPLLDPDPAGRTRVVSAMPPEHYESAVARAIERIRAGALDKVVLAREVQVHAGHRHQAVAVLGVLREAFPSCFTFCVGRGGSAFLAASPELLVRRDGLRAGTLALAGSTRRSADPSVDDHLGEQLMRSDKDREEQAIVVRRIVRALSPLSVWVTAADEPVIARMANIQHLATPIRAQLARPVSVVELAGVLHPTPAVGGEPIAAAGPLIPALEGLDRGWYAGPVGWTDANEDGEFCVALRCALLTGAVARCYAGVGVMADSDPAAELAETEVKLQALLPLLAL